MSAIVARPRNVSISNDSGHDDENVFNSGSTSFGSSSKPSLALGSTRSVNPLGPAKLVASVSKRGVIFSPDTQTKLFNSADAISTDSATPPSSIRQYPDNETDAPSSSPSSPSFLRGTKRLLSDQPSLARSILKSRVQEIRLASSVEEGTLNNKEPARLLVSGTRPRLLARDSFQLAMLRRAASDGMTNETTDKGKGKAEDEAPGSDDTTASDGSIGSPSGASNSSEIEEEMEEGGALATGSLVEIILEGAEDLLTLEEAYTTLTLRLRETIQADKRTDELGLDDLEAIRISTRALRQEAPAIVRAMQRDLQRLLGKVPTMDSATDSAEQSPFRGLMPLRDDISSPTPAALQAPRSPQTTQPRQGYSEAEVRYRREAAGVGAALLRFLAFVFHSSHLYSCFTDADLQSLLDQVVMIPRTPRLPTPNPKRTYFLSILLLAQMRLPASCVQPSKDKIARALESAIGDTLGTGATQVGAKEGQQQIKREGLQAVCNLMTTYPSIFLSHYSDFLPGCLRNLYSTQKVLRSKASAACAAFAAAKYSLMSDIQAQVVQDAHQVTREAWTRVKSVVQKSEFFVVSHLKGPLKGVKAGGPYDPQGGKKTEWATLESMLKDSISGTEVYWGCGVWAVLVSLMGNAYGGSGLASSLDHIMERSLQASTNIYRPTLGKRAWNHAIHAYLSGGMATSITGLGEIITSFKPFAGSAHQNADQRISTVQFPIELALQMANDTEAVTRVLVMPEGATQSHYTWQRAEKAKKLNWLITCGLGAATVMYAYTGIALYHRDQPAKEMTAISGLPSSDGAPMPDSALEEDRLDRLDQTWTKVAQPLISGYLAIKGVDRLKLHAWSILDAITSPNAPKQSWSLDRILCQQYLSPEVFALDQTSEAVSNLVSDLDSESLKPSEIPSWGGKWIVRNLHDLLELFEECLSSVTGINYLPPRFWAKTDAGVHLLPLVLYRFWTNIVRAVAAEREDEAVFADALRQITQRLVQIFHRDVISYLPVNAFDASDKPGVDTDTVRIALFTYLFDAVTAILTPEIIGGNRIRPDDIDGEQGSVFSALAASAFGANDNGEVTVAGVLLGQMLRNQVLALPLESSTHVVFRSLIRKLIDVGCQPTAWSKLLGDLTNQMPWILSDQDAVQLDVWRILAQKWTTMIDLAPSSSASSTNHTGALLVSLLSHPFRNRQVNSAWQLASTQNDLEIWTSLLEVTVLRFRARHVGSNFGVLETLAAHLSDFLDPVERTRSSTITLSCLAAALKWISFVPTELHHGSHFSINENHVPIDFLRLVSEALQDAYPSPETFASSPEGPAISPAIPAIIKSICETMLAIPSNFVMDVLLPVKDGLATWLTDSLRTADSLSGGEGQLANALDDAYISLLNVLSATIQAQHLPATGETLGELIELFAPRLSRARHVGVPQAFQRFWQTNFVHVTSLDLSADVETFLLDVMAAVPGMMKVPGLRSESQMSDVESRQRYPHAQPLAREDSPARILVDTTVEVSLSDINTSLGASGAYDADVSLTQQDRDSPAADIPMAPSSQPGEYSFTDDVFGPMTTLPLSKRGRSKRRAAPIPTPAMGASLPGNRGTPTNEDEDCIVVSQSPNNIERLQHRAATRREATGATPRTSSGILASTAKWLKKSWTFSGFSPRSATFDLPTAKQESRGTAETAEDDVDELLLSPESARKRKREEEVAIVSAQAEERSGSIAASPRRSRRSGRAKSESQDLSPGVPMETSEPAVEPQVPAQPAADESGTSGEPSSSSVRTERHTRLLQALQEATAAKEIVSELDYDGVMELIRNADALKAVAMENIQKRVEQGRRLKRSRRS